MSTLDPNGTGSSEPEGSGRPADFPGTTAHGNHPAPADVYGQGSPGTEPSYGQPYPQGYGPAYGQPPMRHGAGMATAALVLGILALILCWTVVGGIILGLLGLILGIIAAGRARRGEAPGRGRAIAGVITGALGLVLAIALIAIGVSIFNSGSGKTFQQCLQQAGHDQAAQQHCATQFQKSISGG